MNRTSISGRALSLYADGDERAWSFSIPAFRTLRVGREAALALRLPADAHPGLELTALPAPGPWLQANNPADGAPIPVARRGGHGALLAPGAEALLAEGDELLLGSARLRCENEPPGAARITLDRHGRYRAFALLNGPTSLVPIGHAQLGAQEHFALPAEVRLQCGFGQGGGASAEVACISWSNLVLLRIGQGDLRAHLYKVQPVVRRDIDEFPLADNTPLSHRDLVCFPGGWFRVEALELGQLDATDPLVTRLASATGRHELDCARELHALGRERAAAHVQKHETRADAPSDD